MSSVSLENVSKRFLGGSLAVDDVSLTVNDREFLVLVGPSGCGKSTTLRLIAGLERCTGGTIRMGDRVVNDVAPKDRNLAMVFQNYALYPHMSVYNNLSFGLRLRFGGGIVNRGIRRLFKPGHAAELSKLRSGIDQQVRQTAERLGIEHLLNRKPHQLSGGERQRVALGRAIVRDPAAFLFDEPLSNLDAKLRQKMRGELKRLHREMQATMIYVTHDQVEAMTLGDRVAVMNGGKVLQIDSPLAIYNRPANLFVARFVGSVPINLQSGVLQLAGSTFQFQSDWLNIELESEFGPKPGVDLRSVVLGFRAEDVRLTDASPPPIRGTVAAIDRLGDMAHLHVSLTNDQTGQIADNPEDRHADNLNKLPRTTGMLVVRTTANVVVEVGQAVALAINPERILWFDAKTGKNISKD